MCFSFWYLKLSISYLMSNLPLLWAALLRTSLLLLTWVTTIAEKTQLLLTEFIWYVILNILPSPITSSYLADLQSSASNYTSAFLYTSWSPPLTSNLPHYSTSNLRHCHNVKPSWFLKPCFTSMHQYLFILISKLNSSFKTCGIRS